MMIYRLYYFKALVIIAIVFAGCSKETYQGKQLSAKQIQKLKDEKSFNAKQANQIIENNAKSRQKVKRIEERYRRQEQEHLEALNHHDHDGKCRKAKDPLVIDFY